MIRMSWARAASVEETLALWAASLREIKQRIRPLFTQERVATNAGLSASMIRSSRPCSFSTRSAGTCTGARWLASSQRTSAPRSSAASIMRSKSFGAASELTAARREVQGHEGLCAVQKSAVISDVQVFAVLGSRAASILCFSTLQTDLRNMQSPEALV